MTLQLQQGDELSAMQLAEAVLSTLSAEPRLKLEPALLLELARLYAKHRQYEPAEKALQLALPETQDLALRGKLSLLQVEILMLRHKEQEALRLLEQWQTEMRQNGLAPGQEFFSLSAELNLSQKHYALAFAAAEKCLAMPEENPRFVARAHWVSAKLLFEVEKDAKNALPHCVKAFILYDDERYTPKAMKLCMEIYLNQGKRGEAEVTWKEMQQRYPGKAASMQGSKLIERLRGH